jgi:kynurenine formamidase
MNTIPSYEQLPVVDDAPASSSWGVFGRADQLGSLNFLTAERRTAAAALVSRGAVFNLDLPLHLPAQPFFAVRSRPKHVMLSRNNGTVQDDYLDGFYPQYSSQWDGLRHMRHSRHGFYNWTSDNDARSEIGRLGIEQFAKHGIVGRGVLLDIERHMVGRGDPLAPDRWRALPATLLDEVAAAQGVDIQPGDIIMLRTGVGTWLRAEAERGPVLDDARNYEGPGLAPGDASLAWLWNHQIAALVSDNLAIEAFPFRGGDEEKILHHWAIPLLGMVFGELFDLEDLAADCASDCVYECFFVAKPLHLRGGVGSPANALAMK